MTTFGRTYLEFIREEEKLNKRLIEEVAKRIEGVTTVILVDLELITVGGITRSSFTQWIERENKPKDYNPLILAKFEGNYYPITHLLQFRKKKKDDIRHAK